MRLSIWMIIHLDPSLLMDSSSNPKTQHLCVFSEQPSKPLGFRPKNSRLLFTLLQMGFATIHITMNVGVSYTSVSSLRFKSCDLKFAVYFLLHFPSNLFHNKSAWPLTSILLYEARTFLERFLFRDHLVYW